jgi:hypothetical protein
MVAVPAAVGLLLCGALWGTEARAQDRSRDQPSTGPGQEKVPEADKDPFRGSIFIFDQSITTQTAGVGFQTPQSYWPYYGLWMSLRPRYYLNDHFFFRGRLDYTKEFTNTETTTNRDEDVFGDLRTDFMYQTPFAEEGPWKNTKVAAGVRAMWPTSKISIDNGVYVTAGLTGDVTQKFVLRGEDAPALNGGHVGLTLTYLHPFSNSSTPYTPNFAYTRQDTDGGTFISHQITGQTLAEHTLLGLLDFGLDITPKLAATLDLILVNQWHYAPTSACVATAMGCAAPMNLQPDQQFVQQSWILAALDYEIVPELSVGIGYYNLANTIASDGTVKTLWDGGAHSLLWSPDARFFLDFTANLDKLYEDASGKYKSKPSTTASTAAAARTARERQVLSQVR